MNTIELIKDAAFFGGHIPNERYDECRNFFDNVIEKQLTLTDEYLDNPVFKIAVATPYPVNDIMDFMALTGIKLKETEVLLKRFSEYGISNIKDVNTLAKLGYFHYC